MWFNQFTDLQRLATAGLALIVLCASSSAVGASLEDEESCDSRFSNYSLKKSHASNAVMRTQNFILGEIVENRIDCAKRVAEISELEKFRSYFIALAHYFDFGKQTSNIIGHRALMDFSYDNNTCLSVVGGVLGALNHSDCSAPYLMSAFLLLETDNVIYRQQQGEAFKTNQAFNISNGGISLFWTGLVGHYPVIIQKHGKPTSLLIDSRHAQLYTLHMLKIWRELKDYIDVTFQNAGSADVIFLGTNIGKDLRPDKSELPDKFELIETLIRRVEDEIVKTYSQEWETEFAKEIAVGNTVAGSPKSYCHARTYILDLIYDGYISMQEKENLAPFINCVKFYSSRWDLKS